MHIQSAEARKRKEGREGTYCATVLLHEWANNLREQRRNIALSNLAFVSRYFEPHADLNFVELSLQLALLRVLPKPASSSRILRYQHSSMLS